MANKYILEMRDIKKSFLGTEVLHGINLNIQKGEIHGLVGENGAGKSTMMSIMGGVYIRDHGEMFINGEPYKPTKPSDATNVGIAFIHQEFSLFEHLSVAQNMFIDDFPMSGVSINTKEIDKKTQKYIDLFGIDITPKTKIRDLPMGIRQIVEISKALEKNPKIIIFDEPTTSLSPKEKDELFVIMNNLKNSGVSIIFISHILEDILDMCDNVSIIRDGNSIGTFEKKDLTKQKMISNMVGRELNQVYPTIEKSIGEQAYVVEDFIRKGSDVPVSFDIKKGEIVGLFGLMGAGRTELLRSLYGIDENDGGKITILGNDAYPPNPKKCIDAGMAYVTEDRRNEGLIITKTVSENSVLVVLNRFLKKFKVVNTKLEKDTSEKIIKQFSIKAANPSVQPVGSLSGGNQQKVVIGKWIASEPKILFLDEPTRGVDVGAKYEIYTYILQLAKEGCAVLVVSSEMEEVMGICDRIMVMNKDKIVASVPKEQYNQEVIIKYSLEGDAANDAKN